MRTKIRYCFLLLTMIIGIAFFATLGESRFLNRRQRRSFLSLGDMVSTLTDMNPANFVDYGLWCGFGGGGEPVDAVDRCCRSHDHCYDEAHAGVCKSWEGHLLLINYRYDVQETHITCRGGQSSCSSAVCACDVGLALCLRRHKSAYNPNNSGLRNKETTNDSTTEDNGKQKNEDNETIQKI